MDMVTLTNMRVSTDEGPFVAVQTGFWHLRV
jgi:hypothetical protein